jgi:hypothetical protein
MPSGELYRKYCKLLETLSWIELINCMNEMVKLGTVKSEGFGKWEVYELVV